MKKLIALTLVLVLVFGICTSALAATPKITIASKSKNQTIHYGETIQWKIKYSVYSYKAVSDATALVAFDWYIEKGSQHYMCWEKSEVTQKGECALGINTTNIPFFKKPSKTTTYKLVIVPYYRKSVNQPWIKLKKVTTKFYVKP